MPGVLPAQHAVPLSYRVFVGQCSLVVIPMDLKDNWTSSATCVNIADVFFGEMRKFFKTDWSRFAPLGLFVKNNGCFSKRSA